MLIMSDIRRSSAGRCSVGGTRTHGGRMPRQAAPVRRVHQSRAEEDVLDGALPLTELRCRQRVSTDREPTRVGLEKQACEEAHVAVEVTQVLGVNARFLEYRVQHRHAADTSGGHEWLAAVVAITSSSRAPRRPTHRSTPLRGIVAEGSPWQGRRAEAGSSGGLPAEGHIGARSENRCPKQPARGSDRVQVAGLLVKSRFAAALYALPRKFFGRKVLRHGQPVLREAHVLQDDAPPHVDHHQRVFMLAG